MASNRSKRILQSVLAIENNDNIPRKRKKPDAVKLKCNDIFKIRGAAESPIPEHSEAELIQLQELLGDVFRDENGYGDCDNLMDNLDILPVTGKQIIRSNTNSPAIPDRTADTSPEMNIPPPSLVPDVTVITFSSLSPVEELREDNSDFTPSTMQDSHERSPETDSMNHLSARTITDPAESESVVSVLDSRSIQQDISDTPLPSPIHPSNVNCNSQFCSNCSTHVIDVAYLDTEPPTPSTITSIGSPFTPTTSKNRKKTYKSDKGKKRKAHKENWQVIQRKKLKNTGQKFTNADGKIIEEKILKDPCSEKCRLKCSDILTEGQRLKIFQKFWSLGDRSLQWKYVIKYTEKNEKARRTTKETKHGRQYTYIYYLPNEKNKKVKVCKTMFLNTISSGERIISTAWKKDQGYDIIEADGRGKYDHKKIVINDEMVRSVCDHVKSFPLVESHRIRQDSKKLYLDGIESVSRMFKLYCEWDDLDKYSNKARTKRQYRDIVNEHFNIAIHRPKKDICDICHSFSGKNNHTDIELRQHEAHLQQKEAARLQKLEDKQEAIQNKKLVVATFDFQKVLTTPHGEVSILYYKRKLPTLNFTVYNAADKTAKCYMWHEGIAKRGANEVSSCLYNFIKEHAEKGVEEFRFWSDNCGGQNRNRIVFTLYMLAAREFNVTITHRFLEKGHTQNEGDSVHSVIERASTRKMIYVPEEWYCLVRWAKSEEEPYSVYEMMTKDFYNIKDLLKGKNWSKNTFNEKVQWSHLREVRVNKEQYDRLEYKTEFGKPSKTIVVLRCATRNNQRFGREFQLVNAYDGPLPVSFDKHKDLVDLCSNGIIPEKYHNFYKELPHLEKCQKKKHNVPRHSNTSSDSE